MNVNELETIQPYTQTQIKVKEQLVVRKDMNVNEHERLSNLTLPDSTKNCPSINVFKSRLNLNIIYDKPTLAVQDRFFTLEYVCGVVLLIPIYFGKILKIHRVVHVVVERPLLIIFSTVLTITYLDNATYLPLTFLFPCPLNFYSLVGSNELTINQNTEIFLSVQKFILSSKRFTRNSQFTNPFHFPAKFIPYGVKYNYHFTDPYNVI